MYNFGTIKKSSEFDLIFRTGIRLNGELVRILYLRDERISGVEFGCTVGKKLGKAHIRNRGKRILREAFRQLEIPSKSGLKIILSLREKGLKAKTQDVKEELENLLRRKKLLCRHASQ